jgi:hypothetical protein
VLLGERPPSASSVASAQIGGLSTAKMSELSLWLAPLSFELQATRRLSLDEDVAFYFVISGREP